MQHAAGKGIDAGLAEGPPPGTTGVVGWARKNLFNGWFNSLLTVAIFYLLYLIVPPIFGWLVGDAIFTHSSPEECRKVAGACWAFVHEKHRLALFGRYPYEQHWRPLAAMIILLAALVFSCDRRHWRPWLGWVWAGAIGAFLLFMGGGALSFGYRSLLLIAAAYFTGAALRRARHGGSSTGMLYAAAALALLALFGGMALGALDRLAASRAGFRLPVEAINAFEIRIPTGLTAVDTNLWGGLPLTLMLSVFGIAVAFPVGIVLALGRRSRMPVIRMLCIGYIEMIRGVPLISLLFVASFVLPLFLPQGVNFDAVLRAQVAIIMFSAAYLAEVVRGGLQAIPKGQHEAAAALGLGYWQTTSKIVLPQALRLVIPPIVNTFIGLFKDTTLVGIVGLTDFLLAVQAGVGDLPWRPYYKEAYVFAAFVYFVFCYAISKYSQHLEGQLETGRQKRR
jgi:general L-amino acid transport system permease protein